MLQRVVIVAIVSLTALSTLLGLFALATPAYAADHIYPGCAATIQACIDNAATGDRIIISPGVYTESLTLNRPISLTGVSSATTMLVAEPGQRVLTITGATINSSVVISGLTLAGGDIDAAGTCPAGCGGGILITETAQPTIVQVTFENNQAFLGGGLYAQDPVSLTNVYFSDNTAVRGAGIYGSSSVVVTNGSFENNLGYVDGGGIHVNGVLTAENSQFISNVGQLAGGGVMAESNTFLSHTLFMSNTTLQNGGAMLSAGKAIIENSQFIHNECTGAGCVGGGVVVQGSLTSTTFVRNSQFLSNKARGGAAGLYVSTRAVIDNSLFEGNATRFGFAGALFVTGHFDISGTMFISNSSRSFGAAIVFEPLNPYTATGTIVNSLLVENHALDKGTALYAFDSRVDLLHVTIADSELNPQPAIYADAATIGITNSVIASHSVGIESDTFYSNTIEEDYNLFFANTIHLSGTINSGGHSLFDADPVFVDVANRNYRLDVGSAAVDNGLDMGILVDLDGNLRPQGGGFDRGAYEQPPPVEMTIIQRMVPDGAVLPGQLVTYTLTFTNLGILTATAVTITDLLPITLTNITASSNVPITPVAGSNFVWQVAEMPASSSGFITLTAVISPHLITDTTWVNTAVIHSPQDGNPANNTSFVTTNVLVPHIQLTADVFTGTEQASGGWITLTMDGVNPYADVVVVYTASDETAVFGLDYPTNTGFITFPPGITIQAFFFPLINDHLVENPETLHITLSPHQGASMAATTESTFFIFSDDRPIFLPFVVKP